MIDTGITPRKMVFTDELYAALLEKEPSLEGKSAKEQRSEDAAPSLWAKGERQTLGNLFTG